jgi:hypothetical protein
MAKRLHPPRGTMSQSTVVAALVLACAGCAPAPTASTVPSPSPSVASPAVRRPLFYALTADATGAEFRLDVHAVGADGRLGPAREQPLPLDGVVGGIFPDGPRGLLRAVRGGDPAEVVTYAVGGDGSLSVRAKDALSGDLAALTVAPAGDRLYAVLTRTGQIDAFRLSETAPPERIAGAPFEKEGYFVSIRRLQVTPSGRTLLAHGFRAYKTHGALSFTIDGAGALAQADQKHVHDPTSNIAVSADERHVFVAETRQWRSFALGPHGTLGEEPQSPWPGPWTWWIAPGPSPHWLIAAGEEEVRALAVADGIARAHASAARTRIGYPRFAAAHGGCVYVAGDHRVAVFKMDEATGALSPLQELLWPVDRRIHHAVLADFATR